jgi:hypothetical protein
MKSASVGRVRPLSALFVALLMAGCIKVGSSSDGDEDGDCESDDDCDSGELCNDGQCESPGSGGTGGTGGTNRGGTSAGGTSAGGTSAGGTGGGGGACSWYCEMAVRCGDTTTSECLSDCGTIYAVGGACTAAMDVLAQCVRAYPNDCAAAEASCSDEANALVVACSGGSEECPYTNDGMCDEPEGLGLCPEGTDVNDCAGGGGGCPFTEDGECDEPEGLGLCPEGSDAVDCACQNAPGNTCTFACDMECDEAAGTGLCPAGSDASDCANYP